MGNETGFESKTGLHIALSRVMICELNTDDQYCGE
jgi:hypothetical protein